MNEHWDGLARRPFDDGERALIDADIALGPDWSSPISTASIFLSALDDVKTNAPALDQLVAPFTRRHWGDFSESKALLDSIENYGMSGSPQYFEEQRHVAYVKILRGVDEGFVLTEDQVLMLPAVLTMTFSESKQLWLVYAFGQPVAPELVAPGDTNSD